MSQRERNSIIISGLFIVIGLPVMWFGYDLPLKNFGLVLWIGEVNLYDDNHVSQFFSPN